MSDQTKQNSFIHTWRDSLAITSIGCILAIFSALLSSYVPQAVMRLDDNFFGSDINRVVGHLTNPGAQHSRIWVHPLFVLLGMPLGMGLMRLSFSDLQACMILVSASASGTGIFLYLTCRNLGLLVRHSILIVMLFASSGAFMFWWAIPETFPFAGLSLAFLFFLASKPPLERTPWSKLDIALVIALLSLATTSIFTNLIKYGPWTCLFSLALLAILMRRKIPQITGWSLAGVLLIGITMSNWAAALIATFLRRRLRDFIVISAVAFLASCALAVLQNRWMVTTPIFYHSLKLSKTQGVQSELGPQKNLDRGVLKHIAFFTMVFPPPDSRVERQSNKLVIASKRAGYIFSGPQKILNAFWAVLLAIGTLGALRPRYRTFWLSLAGFVGFNWVLHSQYGDDTFLYAVHFLIPLTLIPALGMTGKYRDLVAIVCLAFVIGAFDHNYGVYVETVRKLVDFYRV
jgi:hypothetical protein